MAIKKSNLIIISIRLIAAILSPTVSSADVYVGTNFYIGAGVTIGCVTIFFAFGVGEHSHYAQEEEKLENFRETLIADGNTMRLDSMSPQRELPVQDGMFKVFTW